MTATTAPAATGNSWLDKSATIANPGFNRWLVPPAALAIHLCIGMSYGLSVFWLPLSKAIPGAAPAECKDMGGVGRADDDDLQLARQRPALHLHHRHRRARALGGPVRRMARARRSAQGRPRRRGLLGRRLPRSRRSASTRTSSGSFGWSSASSAASASASATFRRSRRWSNGFPTGAAWRPAWRSWVLAAAR